MTKTIDKLRDVFNKQKRYKIVYPPTIDYNFMTQRPQKIMKSIAELGHTVYYCQNFQQRKGVKPYPIQENLFICPDPDLIKDNIDVLWIGNPGIQDKFIGKYREKLVVYDCVDDFYKAWGTCEDMLTRKADIIFTTCNILYERKCAQKGEDMVYLIPNAVTRDFFDLSNKPALFDMEHLKRKVRIGYAGAMADWFDYDLLLNLAGLFNKFDFVLIGCEFHKMPEGIKNNECPNIHWLGVKPHSKLKFYLDALDVCIIPFRRNEITEATDPVKLYEYLALGKPVVATCLKTMNNFKDIVYLADGYAEFAQQINLALFQKGEPWKSRRIDFVKNCTWHDRAEEAMRIIGSELKNRGC
jgi:glycosyltransferase involved in cell wall biosynthesis